MRILILLLLPFTLFSQVQIPEEKGVIIYHYEDFEDDTTNVGWRTGDAITDFQYCDWCNPGWWGLEHANQMARIIDTCIDGRRRNVLRACFPDHTTEAAHGFQTGFFLGDTVKECYITYKVYFHGDNEKGFQWKKGGKLNGVNCEFTQSGTIDANDGFKAGNMWWRCGIMRFWIYHQGSPSGGAYFWDEFNGGAFYLDSDTWYTLTIRYVMNDPGVANGIAEGFVNGHLWGQQTGIEFCSADRPDCGVNYEKIYSFYGGGDSTTQTWWDNYLQYADWCVYDYLDTINIPHGIGDASDSGRILNLPFQNFTYIERFDDTLYLYDNGDDDTLDIAAPDYPGTYDKCENWKTLIVAPEGYQIKFTVETIDMRGGDPYSILLAYNGKDTYSTRILMEDNGYVPDAAVTSDGRYMIIWFRTNYVNQNGSTGFDGYVNIIN